MQIFSSDLPCLWPLCTYFWLNTFEVYADSTYIPFQLPLKKRSMQSPLAHKHYTTICIMFSSRLLVYDIIQLTFTDLNQISIFNSTHYFLLYSPYRFDSNFPIQIPILFYYNYINLTENLWFNSAFLIQFNSSFTIQFDLVNHFFQHILHAFKSSFLIKLSKYYSIWLRLFNSIRLNFTIWFDYQYINSIQKFQFDSVFLIPFDSYI